MLIFRRNSSILQSCFQFYKILNRAERTSSQVNFVKRIFSNTGCLISGCCFSRQSEEEILLPKENHDISDSQTTHNSQPPSTIVQHAINAFRMKRSSTSDEGVPSHHANANSDLPIETCRKKQKTEDNKIDDVEEVNSVSTNDNLDLPKNDCVRSETAGVKPKKHRPNYFVAIKISDTQIIKAFSELQQHMLDKDHRLEKSMIQLTTLHITLMVMYIGDTETHDRALKTLENIHQEHNDDLSKNPLKLEFKGLSHFQNRVLYAKLSGDESYKRLHSLAESVRQHYTNASISSSDSKTDFTPHLTVVKIRDMGKKKKKKELPKKIDPSLYRDFSDNYFGTQEVQSIQLLSMTDPKDEVGYYSGTEIYFSAFEPKVREEYLIKMMGIEEKKKNVKEVINALMKEKLK